MKTWPILAVWSLSLSQCTSPVSLWLEGPPQWKWDSDGANYPECTEIIIWVAPASAAKRPSPSLKIVIDDLL